MAANLDTAINSKVDGILIDHGRSEALKPSRKSVTGEHSRSCVR